MSLFSSRLLDFPNEILISILLDIDDEVDRFCFGMTCVHLFTLCEEYWLRTYKVGSKKPRFICIADFTEWAGFLRPSFELFALFLSDSKTPEQYLLDIKSTPDTPTLLPLSAASSGPTMFALRRLAVKAWKRLLPVESKTINVDESVSSCDRLIRSSLKEARNEFCALGIEASDAEVILRSLMRQLPVPIKSPDAPNAKKVLRNHTKKLFVLAHPLIDVHFETFDAKAAYGMDTTLVQLALSQICFPEDDGSNPRGLRSVPWEIVNASWAGDSLDIVSESELLSDFRSGVLDPKKWVNDTGRMMEYAWAINSRQLSPRRGVNMEERKSYLDSVLLPGKTPEELLALSL